MLLWSVFFFFSFTFKQLLVHIFLLASCAGPQNVGKMWLTQTSNGKKVTLGYISKSIWCDPRGPQLNTSLQLKCVDVCSSKRRLGPFYCILFKPQDLMQTDRPVSRRDLCYEPDINKDHNQTPTKTEEYKTCPHTHTQAQEHSEKVSSSLIVLVKTHSHKRADRQ